MAQNPFAATIAQPFGSTAQKQLSVGKQGDLTNSSLHGSKYTLAYRSGIFVGANQVGVTTSAGLATTYVGCCLSNPAGNINNLEIRRIAGQFIVAPSTVTGIGLITGFAAAGIVTHTTALTPFSSLIGGGAAVTGKLDSACTLVGTPVWTQWFSETLIATDLPAFSIDLEGAIVLIPGAYAAIGTTIAGPASGFVGSFEWAEVPV